MTQNTILVINCGSSSLKFSLMDAVSGQTYLSGLAERLSSADASIKIEYNDDKEVQNLNAPYDHECAIAVIVSKLHELNLADQIFAVGHRVVHGGELYSLPTLITDEVKSSINDLSRLAPLHNPANLIGIDASQKAFPSLQQVAIFDTAFHQTMPEKAFMYGLPYDLYKEHSIRRYGFHGTSHYFVAHEAAKLAEKPLEECNFISAHLGNGCSITAIKNGKSVDTSMGLTPLEGVIMGTRSGDVDPGIIFHLVDNLGYSIEEVNKVLNKESGLLGLSQASNDLRTLLEMQAEGNAQAKLALEIFCYRVAKTIASYSAALTDLDGLIFTGGIGENSLDVRQEVLKHLALLGFKEDAEKNAATRFGASGNISQDSARSCWVIPTNEEWVIAEQTYQLLNK